MLRAARRGRLSDLRWARSSHGVTLHPELLNACVQLHMMQTHGLAETPTRTGCAEMTLTGAGARVEPTHAEPTAETPARAGLTHAEPTAEAPARAELAHAELTAETPARADTAPQPPKPKKRMRKSKDVKKWTKK